MLDELKKIRGSLHENFDNIIFALDNSVFMLWFSDMKDVIHINKKLAAFMKENKEKSFHDSFLQNIHKDDIKGYLEIVANAYQNETSYTAEYRLKNSNNEYIWLQEESVPVFFRGDSTCKGFISGCININSQKKAESKLLSSEERYRRLFEAARDGIVILNSENGKITDINPFLTELLGYTKKELVGLSLWEVGAFKNVGASKEIFKILQETGYVKYDDLPLETKDGRLIPVGFVSNAYMAGTERVIQCNIRDIGEQKRLEAAEKALELLKQDKIKSAFIADVAHELRTPLAIIKGNVDLALRTKESSETTKETYDAINVEVDHLAEILSNLSILTNESHVLFHTIEKSKLDISKIIPEVVARFKKLSKTRNITIETKPIPSAILFFNKSYLEKLFSNIISNAIYYGKENGSVVISAQLLRNQIEISVTDNGIGISNEDLPNIFERFFRTKNARDVNSQGTGLGLAISKWIVEAHKGTISVTSEVSVGTTFTMILPLAE